MRLRATALEVRLMHSDGGFYSAFARRKEWLTSKRVTTSTVTELISACLRGKLSEATERNYFYTREDVNLLLLKGF